MSKNKTTAEEIMSAINDANRYFSWDPFPFEDMAKAYEKLKKLLEGDVYEVDQTIIERAENGIYTMGIALSTT